MEGEKRGGERRRVEGEGEIGGEWRERREEEKGREEVGGRLV